jgi:methionine-rich copper-binding protein CopC
MWQTYVAGAGAIVTFMATRPLTALPLFASIYTVVLLLVALASAPPASAHEEPMLIEPASGLELTEPPERVRIFYRETVEEEYLRVYDEKSDRVDEGNARVVGPIDDPDYDIDEEAIYAVGLEALSEGTYTVEYSVTSGDGHTHGHSYRFCVVGGEAAATTDKPSVAAREGHDDHDHNTVQGREQVPETGGPSVGLLLVLVAAVAALFGALATLALYLSRYVRS